MSVEQKDSDKHKFLHDSEMTYQDVFNYAFRWLFVPLLQNLGNRLGENNLIAMLKEAASQVRVQGEQQAAGQVPSNDLATFTGWAREPNPFWQNTLTFEIVEDTERAFEVKVTECLWAKTFRDAGSEAIGYATVCHGDFAACEAFNPRIKMIRTQTLMEGHDCCNHRWIWQAD